MKALNRGIKETIADPAAAVRHVKERDAIIDVALEERRLRYFIEHFVATPQARQSGLGSVDSDRLKSNVSQIVEAFNLKQAIDPAELFNSAFIPSASDRRF